MRICTQTKIIITLVFPFFHLTVSCVNACVMCKYAAVGGNLYCKVMWKTRYVLKLNYVLDIPTPKAHWEERDLQAACAV